MATPDHLRNRYIDELIGATSVLDSIESAAVAEAWASSAVAEWSALGGNEGQLAPTIENDSALGAMLIAWMEGGEPPTGDAEWIGDVGRHVLTKAVRLTQSGQHGEVGLILEYTAPSGDRHDVSVTIVDDAVFGVTVGPEGLADAAIDDEDNGLGVKVMDSDEAVGLIRTALGTAIGQLSEAAEATLPLLLRRVGMSESERGGSTAGLVDRTIPERDNEDDVYSAALIASAMRSVLAEPMPSGAVEAKARFVERVAASDPDALTVFDIAGIDAAPARDGVLNDESFLRLVGAYMAPVDLSAHTDPQFAALIELEPADWVGVVLGLARADAGTLVDGDSMVRCINRAPEITTTIPKSDAPRLAWTFEHMLFSWELTGVIDENGAVTNEARWLLIHATQAVWATR